MILRLIIWGLVTGTISGAVWAWIVMFQRQRRLDAERRPMDELDERVEELEKREARVAQLEERLDFAERLLTQKREEQERKH